MSVRVRFAPSPTGFLHIGGARTALYNWLFARRHGGRFILRIEDTDQKRAVPGAVGAIMDALRWLGIDWDEGPDGGGPHGPYVQTERADLYRHWAQWLVDAGEAYPCFCTADELREMRSAQVAAGQSPGYDRRCRRLPPDEVAARLADGRAHVIRFKMPLEGETVIDDLIRGDITYNNEQINDEVLLKSDGLPTYHLANVVDDHLMEISHILRADEWINTAPLHINLYRAFGWELPQYAHLSLILNPSGKGKLSKRTQAFDEGGSQVLVKVEEFRDAGYLPEAVVNFLANVGWSFGDDREKFTMAEAIPRFDLRSVNPAPARLPYSKLEWLNGQYIQEMAPLDLARAVRPYLEAAGLEVNVDALLVLMPAMSVRLRTFPDAVPFLRFLGDDAPFTLTRDDIAHKHMPWERALAALRAARDFTTVVEPFTVDALREGLYPLGEKHTLNGKAGPFLGQLRLVVTGQSVSPPLFESMVALGRERTIERLDAAIGLGNE